jgi:hypothetical protein
MKMKRTVRIDLWGWITLCVMAASWAAPPAHGQNSSLHRRQAFEASRSPLDPFPAEDAPLTLKDASWTHAPLPPPREIQKHDIISVRVDLLARMQADGELRRRKNARYDARLNDWIIFNGLRWVKPSPQSDGDPRTRGELRSEYRSLGELETSESLAFNLAVEVVDIRPTGIWCSKVAPRSSSTTKCGPTSCRASAVPNRSDPTTWSCRATSSTWISARSRPVASRRVTSGAGSRRFLISFNRFRRR